MVRRTHAIAHPRVGGSARARASRPGLKNRDEICVPKSGVSFFFQTGWEV